MKKIFTLLLTTLFVILTFSVKAQINDLPCNAIFLPLGIYIAGNNTGATSTSEPASVPSCFDAGGARNTVWYKFNAPVSGCVKIKTVSNSLTNTQIALYNGPCAALGAELVCNDDATGCAGTIYPHSQMQVCGLTSFATYFIVVDGRANNVGSFSIMVIDGGVGNINNFSPAPIQDCALPQLICGTSISYPNPGFQGVGNICDHAPSNCLLSGERGSAWFRLVCNGTGNIEFTIVPNNWAGGATGTDYDFGVWRNGGPTGPNFDCSTLQGNMVRCNYSAIGVTGCYQGGGVAPPGYAGSGGAFAAMIPVVAGDILLIEISNFAISTTGFSATFTGPIATASSPGGTLVWTGTASTDWFNVNNWGGCALPTCQTNVIIPNFTAFQPVITGQNAGCRNIDINLGASVTLNSGWQLMVCNDYLNNGGFSANNGSIVLFTDTCTICPAVCGTCAAGINHNQVIGGNLTGTNKFWHVIASKPTGWNVQAAQDIDMAGNFTVLASVGNYATFDASGVYHKVGGNFNVQKWSQYLAPATLEFNGTTQQTYFNSYGYNNAGWLLNSCVVNNSLGTNGGAGAILLDTLISISPSGTFTLTNGTIKNGANPAANPTVNVNNTASAAVNSGNVTSFVDGKLKRFTINLPRSYDFPVGSGTMYELLNLNFTVAPASNSNLTTNFTAGAPNATPVNIGGVECSSVGYNQGYLNHGSWKVVPAANSAFPAGTLYTATAGNTGYTNATGDYWTIVKRFNTAPPWALQGSITCNPSPVIVSRTGMFQFGALGSEFAIAQGLTPLPVELLTFEARSNGTGINVNWATSSEKNNKGFDLERTTNPSDNFEKIAWVDGHGSTSNVNYYHYVDQNVKPGVIYYYRLKQTDFNGNFEFSKIASGRIGLETLGFTFSTIPNPYSGSTSITYTLRENSKVRIEVINVMGQQVKELYNNDQEAGDYHYEFSAKAIGFTTGVYNVKVYINDQSFSKRILETE